MSQAQYRRAAKPGGFQPINVGGQSIARMREESARVPHELLKSGIVKQTWQE